MFANEVTVHFIGAHFQLFYFLFSYIKHMKKLYLDIIKIIGKTWYILSYYILWNDTHIV